MAGENDDLNLDEKDLPNAEGLETEADAGGEDGDEVLEGAESEGTAEGDGSDAEEGQVVEGEPRRPSRGEQRFQTLSRTAKEANERAARAEQAQRDLEARLARLERPAPPQERELTPDDLALMTTDQIIDYRLGKATKGFEQKLGAIQWHTMESADQAKFQSVVASNPVAARFASQVEAKLAEIRSQGSNAPRENVLKFLMGEAVFAKGAAAKPKAAAAGQRNIARQQVRPGGQRSDTASNRGKMNDTEAREKRLENITF